MIQLQVVGLPKKRHMAFDRERRMLQGSPPEGIRVRFASSDHPTFPVINMKQVQANIQDGFVHLAVVPLRPLDFERIFSSLRRDCRLTQLQLRGKPDAITWADLEIALAKVIEFERQWATRIRPTDLRHPLLLPAPSFEAEDDVAHLWDACDCYYTEQSLADATEVIDQFERLHRRSSKNDGPRAWFWFDRQNRCFKHDKAGHGRSAMARAGGRQFRFAFEVPADFHFDVRCEGKPISLRDAAGQLHAADTHLNVNPWGKVWGDR